MMTDNDGSLIQAGRFSQASSYYLSVSARKWSVPTSAAVSIVATIPALSYEVGQPLPFRFTLRDSFGAPQITSVALPVYAQATSFEPREGIGATLVCTIPVNSSYCDSALLRASKSNTAVQFSVYAEGTLPTVTPTLAIGEAAVTLTARILEAGPYRAYADATIEFVLRPTYLAAGETVSFTDAYSSPYLSITSGSALCQLQTDSRTLPAIFCCKARVGAATTSITGYAEWQQYTANSDSVSVTLSPVVASSPTIKLEQLWPSNPAPLGVAITPVVRLSGEGLAFSTTLPAGSITLTLGDQSCPASQVVISTPVGPIYTNSYSCALTPTAIGAMPLSAQFSGSAALLAVPPIVLGNVNVQAVAGFFARHQVSNSPGLGSQICSPSPGLQCEVTPGGSQSFCTAAPGWQGKLYLRPSSDSDFRLSAAPPVVGPLSGVTASPVQMPMLTLRAAHSLTCELDLNRDGYVDAEQDALALLRAMFGFQGSAISSVLTHPCANRTDSNEIRAVIAQQAVTGVHDINGDVRIDPLNDGLVILRYLLGLRGAALVAGVRFNSYGNQFSPESIASSLSARCGLPPP